jgi:hypothetical protein
MSAAAFEAVLPRLGRLSLDSVKTARAVLVEGLGLSEVAQRHGTSRQRVHAIVKRFQAAMDEVPAGWRRVELWLPPEMVAQVEAMAEQARQEHATKCCKG